MFNIISDTIEKRAPSLPAPLHYPLSCFRTQPLTTQTAVSRGICILQKRAMVNIFHAFLSSLSSLSPCHARDCQFWGSVTYVLFVRFCSLLCLLLLQAGIDHGGRPQTSPCFDQSELRVFIYPSLPPVAVLFVSYSKATR